MRVADDPSAREITALLQRWREGDESALERLTAALYPKLRALAARQLRSRNPTLQTTDLVHEAYVLMLRQHRVHWRNEAHFLAIAARVMRRVAVDSVRRRRRQKRGGDWQRVPLENLRIEATSSEVDWVHLDRCLAELGKVDPVAERVVELRYFSGMTLEQVAAVLSVSRSTAVRRWRFARAWLSHRLAPGTAARGE